MTTTVIPLRDLGQRISEQQAELEKLRKEYVARQTQMSDLTRRKEQLQAQLRQVEEQLQRIDAGTTPPQPTLAATSTTKPATKPGASPVQTAAKPQGSATKARKSAKPGGPKAAAVEKPVMPTAPGGTKNRLTLPAALTQVLAKSARPLSARELADKVREIGYQTKSQDFTKVVWGALGDMANVEHVKGQGYRLKKAKGVK